MKKRFQAEPVRESQVVSEFLGKYIIDFIMPDGKKEHLRGEFERYKHV